MHDIAISNVYLVAFDWPHLGLAKIEFPLLAGKRDGWTICAALIRMFDVAWLCLNKPGWYARPSERSNWCRRSREYDTPRLFITSKFYSFNDIAVQKPPKLENRINSVTELTASSPHRLRSSTHHDSYSSSIIHNTNLLLLYQCIGDIV